MRMHNAFVVTTESLGLDPVDRIRDSVFYMGNPGYTPRFWRRERLAFARPLIHRYLACMALWRWLP